MLKKKFKKLKEILKNMNSVLVAYSGGVDSTFLLKVAKMTVGNSVLAVTAKSEIYPEEEIKSAIKIAKKIKARHIILNTHQLSNSIFNKNPINRCYYCKKELFKKLKKIARKEKINYVIDGMNKDDSSDFRPGYRALKELKIRSPLKEAGLTKKDIRLLSHKLKLPTWNKPALACLASRFPYYTKIDKKKLKMVYEAERYLLNMGFRQVRVRYFDTTARIEVSEKDIQKLLYRNIRKKIIKKFKETGFIYVTLDLEGYRTGSLNEILKNEANRKY